MGVKNRLRISFDYDGTLDNGNGMIRKMARKFQMDGHEVYIITTRRTHINGMKLDNSEVFRAAQSICIPESRVVFTEYEWKADTLNRLGIDIHFDDNEDEFEEYDKSEHCGCNIVII